MALTDDIRHEMRTDRLSELTVGSALRNATDRLKNAGVETPRLDARCLLGHLLGEDAETLPGRTGEHISGAANRRFRDLVKRRTDREPVSRIVGSREFWSLSFRLSSAVLDPRPDSETLVEAALSTVGDRQRPIRALDLGTGSGCLLAALLSELPAAVGVGVDIDPAALATARHNLELNGLASRATLVCGDWGAALAGTFDLVVVNPPYVPAGDIEVIAPEVALHDPHRALFAGRDGLDAYRMLLPELPRLLRHRGAAVIEIGCGQAGAVTRILLGAGLVPFGRRRDLGGIDRCILARPADHRCQGKKGLGNTGRGR